MKIVKFIHTDLGIIVVVDGALTDDQRQQIAEALRNWAQVSPDYPSPFLIVPGDQQTSYFDLRTVVK